MTVSTNACFYSSPKFPQSDEIFPRNGNRAWSTRGHTSISGLSLLSRHPGVVEVISQEFYLLIFYSTEVSKRKSSIFLEIRENFFFFEGRF